MDTHACRAGQVHRGLKWKGIDGMMACRRAKFIPLLLNEICLSDLAAAAVGGD